MKNGTINASSKILDYVCNDVISSKDFKEMDAVIIAIMYSLIKKTEDISFLIKHERYDSLEIIARTALELNLSLRFILKEDTERRALAYFYSYKKQIALKVMDTTKNMSNGNKLLELTDQDKENLSNEVRGATNLNDYITHYENLYQSIFFKNSKKSDRFNWFNLNNNISGIKELMKEVGMGLDMYHYFYGIGSLQVHGISAVGDMTIKDGYFSMKNSIDLTVLNEKVTNYLITAIEDLRRYYKVKDEDIITHLNVIRINHKLQAQERRETSK